MKIRELRLFADVCDTGSLSAAAEANGMSVQNVSKAILGLEGELGRRLFVRTSRGAESNDAARAFLPYARTALKAFNLCESYAEVVRPDADREGEDGGEGPWRA